MFIPRSTAGTAGVDVGPKTSSPAFGPEVKAETGVTLVMDRCSSSFGRWQPMSIHVVKGRFCPVSARSLQ
jgi:hypothetical protein